MMSISFKNLEPSALARESVEARVLAVVEKFPDLQENKIKIVLEMKNSRLQTGPDLFSIQLNIFSGRYEGIKITKSSANLYAALAEICDRLLDLLNRHGDKKRIKSIKQSRKMKELKAEPEMEIEEDIFIR